MGRARSSRAGTCSLGDGSASTRATPFRTVAVVRSDAADEGTIL